MKKIKVTDEVYKYLEGMGEDAENGLKYLIKTGFAIWIHAIAFDPNSVLYKPEQISDEEIDQKIRKWK